MKSKTVGHTPMTTKPKKKYKSALAYKTDRMGELYDHFADKAKDFKPEKAHMPKWEVRNKTGLYFNDEQIAHITDQKAMGIIIQACNRDHIFEELLESLKKLRGYVHSRYGNHGPIHMWTRVNEVIDKAEGS